MNSKPNLKALEKNIVDTIKESQLKLGFTPNPVTLFYPLESLNLLTDADLSMSEMTAAISAYASDILSGLSCNVFEDKIGVVVSAESVRAIHENTEASAFLTEFIAAVKEGCTMEKAKAIFKKYSGNAVLEDMDDDEFDVLAYFPDGEPDAYKYCLANDLGGITYHRFTQQDYENIFGN